MRLNSTWAKSAAILAGLNLAAPNALTWAADKSTARVPRPVRASDVVLASDGDFQGRVVTTEGAAVDAADVSVLQNGKPIARTSSDAQGEFRVSGMKGGLYQVSAGPTTQLVRAWSADTAPPSARNQAVIVQGATVRGQDEWDYFETDEMIIAGIATAALIVGIIALTDEDHDHGSTPSSP